MSHSSHIHSYLPQREGTAALPYADALWARRTSGRNKGQRLNTCSVVTDIADVSDICQTESMSTIISPAHKLEPTGSNRDCAELLADLIEQTPISAASETFKADVVSLLRGIENGQSFAVLPLDNELSPTQAAKLLNISRTHLMRIVSGGDVPFRMVGKHHRFRIEDILAYKETRSYRRAALDELVIQAEELKLGY